MKLKFERATEQDVKGMIDLCNECFFEETDLHYAIKTFNNTKLDPNQIYINGFWGNEVIAHAKITIIPTIYDKMGTYAIINHFCVKEKYRRQHVATDLMTKAIEICSSMNCKRICLWSGNHRIAAHAFYKKFGFNLLETGFFAKEI